MPKKVPDSADKLNMKKQVVYWKPIQSRRESGEFYLNHYFSQLIDNAYSGELLFAIVSMVPKIPIAFEDAVNLVENEFQRAANSGQRGSKPGQSHWYYRNFVKWISDQGYSIELTGDEFETASMCRFLT
jgi:hypothetical protein